MILVIKENQLEIKITEEKNLNINLFEIRLEENITYNYDLLEILFFDCQCALFIFDVMDLKSFNSVKELLSSIDKLSTPYLKKLVIGNKIDLGNNVEEGENVKKYLNENSSIEYIQLSIKNEYNIQNLINKIDISVNEINNNIPINNLNCYYFSEKISETIDFNNSVSIILLGNSGVGKTNLMRRYENKTFSNLFISTFGYADIKKIIKKNDKDYYKLTLWDTAGQERFRCMPVKYYQNADGILLLFDINDKTSFKDITNWITNINDNLGKNHENTIIYLIANKIDYLQEKDYKRIISDEEIRNLADNLKIKYFEISCKWNMNIEEVMARIILDCIQKLKPKVNEALKVKKKFKKKKCC